MNNCVDTKDIAQTLFLGASVTSFFSNMGWSGQPSQLTVNLVTDQTPTIFCPSDVQFIAPVGYDTDNHYYTCSGDSCYVDRDGSTWSSSAASRAQKRADGTTIRMDDKMIPGKVRYKFVTTNGIDPFVSNYWYRQDPGFLGSPNLIGLDGSVGTTKNNGYDIIGTPVFFKMGNFSFGGVVQSWEENLSSGGNQYKVTIDGMHSILNNCFLIVGNYAGTVFSKLNAGSAYGSPRNYVGIGNVHSGTIAQGNIPNVFNVYGFLEACGPENFGGSNSNDDGLSASSIMMALRALTSTINGGSRLSANANTGSFLSGPKTAFGPYGRILVKKAQTYDFTPISTSFNTWGIIPPQVNAENGGEYCEFLLDLSDLPTPPDDFRIRGPVISITDFLNSVSEATGYDYGIDLIPLCYNSSIYNVIKVRHYSRLKQPSTKAISNTVKSLYDSGYNITASTIGKEKNESPARCVLIGGPQQRLYQAKAYRLAFTQTNFIYDPSTKKFVDYLALGNIVANASSNSNTNSLTRSTTGSSFKFGKIKFPSWLSTRNPSLSASINGGLSSLFADDETIKNNVDGITFDTTDTLWSDTEIMQNGYARIAGNYEKARRFTYTYASTWGTSSPPAKLSVQTNSSVPHITKPHSQRFFPLYKDTICPFFGYMMDKDVDIASSASNRDLRRVRPVFLDTWTGQICVLFRASELPLTRANLSGLYGGYGLFTRIARQGTGTGLSSTSGSGSSGAGSSIENILSDPKDWFFVVTESEMRAAMVGSDEFLVYSLAKQYKTDLYIMLNYAYYLRKLSEYRSKGVPNPEDKAKKDTTWDFSVSRANVANPVLGDQPIHNDKGDGHGFIEESARQDFEILYGFVKNIAETYYGKKYMVAAPYVSAKKDESYSSTLSTAVGTAYIYRGGARLTYNYQPTSEGAWEEYGNIIDDSIAVGSKEWLSLTNEQGLIQPILGYNASDSFDNTRYRICLASVNQTDVQNKLNPYFYYTSWEKLQLAKAGGNCDQMIQDFVYPSLNTSKLDASSYVLINTGQSVYNAFGEASPTLAKRKLYVQTQVSDKFVFLDPEQLRDPRIIIDSPGGIALNSSSDSFQEDPSKSMVSNIAAEDLSIYLRSRPPADWDIGFINLQTGRISRVYDAAYAYGIDNSLSRNTSARNMRLAPKMAHPFFAGIPIKSNQFNYGPWTNYPALDVNTDQIFPDNNGGQALNAINNWVLPTNVEVVPDFVPWHYGGMSFLDRVAYKEVKSRINYQSVIETANIEMAGLPIFNIGGAFNSQALNNTFPVSVGTENLYYSEIKRALPAGDFPGSITEFNKLSDIEGWTYSSLSTLTYNTLKTTYNHGSNSPIITHINIDIGSNGVKTSYAFRTYTRKLSLFNKEYSDRLKKARQEALTRDRQLAKINQQLTSTRFAQTSEIESQKRRTEPTALSSLRSKLADWSPVEVMVASAVPYIKAPIRTPPYEAEQNSEIAPRNSTGANSSVSYSVPSDNDLGTAGIVQDGLSDSATQIPFMSSRGRIKTLAQIYQVSELDNFIQQDYGSKAAMSLDGLFSPVSFYPTDNLSTFSLSKYDRKTCPVCKGTGERELDFKKFSSKAGADTNTGKYKIPCNACCELSDKLHSKLYTNNFKKISTQALPPYIVTNDSDADAITKLQNLTSSHSYNGHNIPINLISLQPVVVPYSEFKNPNIQDYEGSHPEGYHGSLTVGGKTRIFRDRSRHSISIVARSAVPQKSLQIYNTIDDEKYLGDYQGKRYNPAFFYKDLAAINNLSTIDAANYGSTDAENNQRFIGLRGPLTVHGWGYDSEGYPVPNAADEPLEIDEYNRPKRFKTKRVLSSTVVTYKDLLVGDVFQVVMGTQDCVKAKSLAIQQTPGYGPDGISNSTSVQKVTYEDDMDSDGGFDAAYKGSIISKTQVFKNGKWTEKRKLKEFYLNWAEHPEIWPVGPVDLRWDENRRVWTAQNPIPQYKMVYVTLEEDLLSGPDTTETYSARGFLDDIEYANIPLSNGYRRMVFVRDRAAYTAPRGAKLLCRYDPDSGYYEPISKPSFSVMGFIGHGSAVISMSYIEGIKKGEDAPTMQVSYDNPLGFEISPDNDQKGVFSFMGGKWVLTATKG